MKLETFIDKLLSMGFIQADASNWYENHGNGMGVFVGIMAKEIDHLGHIPINVIHFKDKEDEETEKDYLTTTGAWRAIKNLLQ